MDIVIHQNESKPREIKHRRPLLRGTEGMNPQEVGDEKSQEGSSFEADWRE